MSDLDANNPASDSDLGPDPVSVRDVQVGY